MKRLGRILLSILLLVPMLVGMAFLSPNLALNATQTAQNGGGGANSLDSPNIGGNSDFKGEDDFGNDKPKSAAWENPIYKTFEQYYSDLNISKETITEKDYTGSGTLASPYVVHSIKGFLYLMDYEVSNISLTSKFLSLDCDIVLNDETFDKDGNVYGGDGVVYNWENKEYKRDLSFNGNNHTIKGFYISESDEVTGNFENHFLGSKIKLIENVVFENVYVYGGGADCVSAIAQYITTISKVKMISGDVIGNGNIAMPFALDMFYVYDSENYCDVYSYYQGASGFGHSLYREMKNCVNYGNIFVENRRNSTKNGRGAGFVRNVATDTVFIENCVNYGTIKAEHLSQCAGIVSWGRGTIRNCVNYGDIYTASDAGGIVAYKSDSTLAIISCKNYGTIFATNKLACGAIFGSLGTDHIQSELEIRDCYAILDYGLPIIGRDGNKTNEKTVDVLIKNCRIDIVGEDYDAIYCLVGTIYSEYLRYTFSNIEINITGSGYSLIALVCYKKSLDSSQLNIKNVIVNVAAGNAILTPTKYEDNGNKCINIESVIFNQAGNMSYYGSDFSDFYVDFKSGKIGLKMLDGKGFYQGKVSEEWLIDKGFEKKQIA